MASSVAQLQAALDAKQAELEAEQVLIYQYLNYISRVFFLLS